MPLARYFFHVGGVLLALLFIADACLPKRPVAGGVDRVSYGIRIHSDRKWPERVVYDTSLPTITPLQIAGKEEQGATASSAIASAKPREQEAFAQLPTSGANQLQSFDSKKRQPMRQHQHKVMKRHTPPPMLLAARQRQFGWFAYW